MSSAALSVPFEIMFETYPDVPIVFGDSAVSQIAASIFGKECKSVLLFSGGGNSSEKSGAYHSVLAPLLPLDMDFPIFKDIPAEPDVECVRRMVDALKFEKPDAVVAIGGGSVMDAAKAAYLSYQTGLDVEELFGVGKATAALNGKPFDRVLCVPTTSGTGSEVTPYANIVDNKRNLKMIIVDKACIPAGAFVEPEFTKSMPPELTLSCALDALCHAVESMLNFRVQNAPADASTWGMESIRLIVNGLPAALANGGSYSAREKLSAAATLAGMCISHRPTGLPHLCSYSLYGKTPHGTAVSAMLTAFWRYYLAEPEVRKITESMAGLFPGENQKTAEDVVDACESFIRQNGGAARLGEVPGLDKSVIKKIASDSKQNPVKLQTAPRPVSVEDSEAVISEILTKAW